MASPLYTLYTSPGTPTFRSMILKREPVVAGRYNLLPGHPTGSEPYGSIEITWTIAPPVERGFAREKIEGFARMPENWDGYGAVRIRTETKQNAIDALEMLHDKVPMPDIIPNPNGTLSFEWESLAGIGHLEIGRTRFSFYIKPRYFGHPVLRDWQVGEPSPDIGQLVISHLYHTEPHIRIITGGGFTQSPIPGRYFVPNNPDATLTIAS
jgi:hypothetical protein